MYLGPGNAFVTEAAVAQPASRRRGYLMPCRSRPVLRSPVSGATPISVASTCSPATRRARPGFPVILLTPDADIARGGAEAWNVNRRNCRARGHRPAGPERQPPLS
ncbi:hypothetical protein KCP73_22635 [Salmonella enterica subsp. enterica]|nr:hypothetical protein KCP73_22635 [Salmonella enterica subsp. enterica]